MKITPNLEVLKQLSNYLEGSMKHPNEFLSFVRLHAYEILDQLDEVISNTEEVERQNKEVSNFIELKTEIPFSLGQRVWFMDEGKIKNRIINQISGDFLISNSTQAIANTNLRVDQFIWIGLNDAFGTKEELINHISK
jgi:hypothetical protein